MQFQDILVVCTGNICRSPMAAALLSHHLADATASPRVGSAGTAALTGQPSAPEAVTLMSERGLDISGHRARQLDYDVLKGTDLVLVADSGHMQWINAQFPFMRGRVHLLGRWQGEIDIADPYRRGLSAFEQVLDRLDVCVADWVEKIQPQSRA